MVSQELIEFIRKAVEKHYTADQITNSLLKQGWKQEEIVEALALISNTANPEPQTAISQPKKKKSSWSLKIEDESDALKTIKDVSNFSIYIIQFGEVQDLQLQQTQVRKSLILEQETLELLFY